MASAALGSRWPAAAVAGISAGWSGRVPVPSAAGCAEIAADFATGSGSCGAAGRLDWAIL